jgi:hypothetical protein
MSFKKLKIELLYAPAIPPQGAYISKGNALGALKRYRIPFCIAALFTIAKIEIKGCINW